MKSLLIVATRWYAERRSERDEYCEQFGLPDESEQRWFEGTDGDLLVLHGYAGRHIAEAIETAAGDRLSDAYAPIYFFHHSVDKDTEGAFQVIKHAFGSRPKRSRRYQSGGGLPAEQLVRALREEGLEAFAELVNEHLHGRQVAVSRLRHHQSLLLRLRLILESAWSKTDADADPELLEMLDRVLQEFRSNDIAAGSDDVARPGESSAPWWSVTDGKAFWLRVKHARKDVIADLAQEARRIDGKLAEFEKYPPAGASS